MMEIMNHKSHKTEGKPLCGFGGLMYCSPDPSDNGRAFRHVLCADGWWQRVTSGDCGPDEYWCRACAKAERQE